MRLRRPLLLFVLISILQWNFPYLMNRGEVTILDVGQGDSILIELPFRKGIYLIDTGGIVQFNQEKWKDRKNNFEIGEDVIVPFLKAKGVRTIDRLILTHGDYDHIGGAKTIIENIEVDEILYSKPKQLTEIEKDIFGLAIRKKVRIRFVQEGESWTVGKIPFYILSPSGEGETVNDRSIVLISKIGGLYWLFTGDLEEGGEQRLITSYPNLMIDVLKVAHHGSKTSSSANFIQQVQPKLAIISVGKNNRYHHPDKNVLHLFLENNVQVLRTDHHGAIRYRFQGDQKGIFEWAVKKEDYEM